MSSSRLIVVPSVLLGLAGLVHAAVTWPIYATVALFGGGALVAFIAEAVVTEVGWLEHHVGPSVAGVPLYVLFGWTGTIYIAFRVALLVTDGWLAILVAGTLATAYDILTDHWGVNEGYWTYTDDLPGPRYRGVPWWNFAGWFLITCFTAALAVPFL